MKVKWQLMLSTTAYWNLKEALIVLLISFVLAIQHSLPVDCMEWWMSSCLHNGLYMPFSTCPLTVKMNCPFRYPVFY